ncbi:hypothetical protein [Azospirillum sp. SYSU D00513]|uniref:hypothetical protein n=1 Tax=Azospirillum sp. SYSU D00513 TaxID=2812561 RepID=UPI001A97C1AC|nr:hypothetical protein [Azospirillum sp. SYSU D00513]
MAVARILATVPGKPPQPWGDEETESLTVARERFATAVAVAPVGTIITMEVGGREVTRCRVEQPATLQRPRLDLDEFDEHLVRVKTDELRVPKGSSAYLLRRGGGTVRLLIDGGTALVADNEIGPAGNARPFVPQRLRLPYGRWTEPDGAVVLFSRDYAPLWRLRPNTVPEPLPPWLWIQHEGREEWLWQGAKTPWSDPATARAMEALLWDAGVRENPPLVDALIPLFSGEAEEIREAVRWLGGRTGY